MILRLAGVIPAGHPQEAELAPGTTAAIMTGGAVPPGADAVIRLEEVRVTPEGVRIFRHVPPMENVAPIGEDVREGELILEAGHPIRPQEINLLAALGILEVPVFARPRVAILSTGDELVPPHETPGPGQIRNSNSPGVAALVRAAGGIPILLGVARDATEVIAGTLRESAGCDLILTTGGVSVGQFDVVREALTIMGAEQLFLAGQHQARHPGVRRRGGRPAAHRALRQPGGGDHGLRPAGAPPAGPPAGPAPPGPAGREGILDQPVLKKAGITRYLRARAYNGPDGRSGSTRAWPSGPAC